MVNIFYSRSQMEQSNYPEEIRLIRDNPDRGEEQGNLPGEQDGSSSTPPQDSSLYDGEAGDDFWSISGFFYRHHVEPRVKLYVPREEVFSIPPRYIDVTRATRTTLDVMLERRIDDYWNIEGDRDRFTILNEKTSRWVSMVRGAVDREANDIQVRLVVARNVEGHVRSSATKRKQNWAIEKPKLENARKLRGV